MKIFRIILLFLIPLFSFSNTSEKEVIIKWEKTRKVKNIFGDFETIMSFQNAVYELDSDNLPVFFERFSLENYNDIVEVSLENMVFENLSDIECFSFSNRNIVTSDIEINISKTIDRRDAFSNIRILPFRKNPEKGIIEKLLSFKLIINIKEGEEDSFNNRLEHTYESVLGSGDWFKIRVNQNGIHKITYNDLLEMGVDITSVDPRNISLFGNGNGMIPERNSVERVDDLIENSIFIYGEDDGSFDSEDYILFYGEQAVQWSFNPFKSKFDHETNLYSDYTYYYLGTNTGTAKRIEEINTSAGSNECRF